MNDRRSSRALVVILNAAACAMLLGSLGLPLWRMHLEAPQYKDEEALQVTVYPGRMAGDLAELHVLNSYIGVHVPKDLPQFRWLPFALGAAGVLGLVAAALPLSVRARALWLPPALLAAALVFAAGQAQWQMHEIGHRRDARTKLVGVKDFSTPLLGRTRVAQFTITSHLHWGALLIGLGLAAQVSAALLSRSRPHSSMAATHNAGAPESAGADFDTRGARHQSGAA